MRLQMTSGDWVAVAAAVIAAVAAVAASFQTYFARDTEFRQLRAYVSPDGLKMFSYTEGGVGASLWWKNFGQTPAYKLHTVYNISVADRSARGEYRSQYLTTEPIENYFILMPSSSVSWTLTRQSSAFSDIKQFREKNLAIVFQGHSDYEDAFGNPHLSSFCYFYDADRLEGYDNSKSFDDKSNASMCNDADINN